MRRTLVPTTALIAAICLAAGSARAIGEDECNLSSNVEISQCLSELLKQEDAELNRVYKLAMASIDKADYVPDAERGNWKTTLQKAQRAWIAFKEADCGELILFEWWGGTGAGIASMACTIDQTRSRYRDLKSRYELE